jgi:pSer/pThr/pTyr-binding forkhead associated (FHA) protein
MPFLIVASKRLPLRPGRNVLGGGEADAPTGLAWSFAVIEVAKNATASIRATRADVEVRVDGVLLGAEPRPLKHGARIEIGGRKLVFADERHVSEESAPEGPSSDTARALVSTDRAERYPIPPTGLDIGRDPNCDIVIASNDVSRWHAQIVPGPSGYQIKDSSTNGVYVNGQRVLGERWLDVGDVIRVGTAQFRLEADNATHKANVSTIDTDEMPPTAPARTPLPAKPATPPTETIRLSRAAQPATPEPLLLATLEILSEGALKGRRFRITRPLVHVGRGRKNDVILPDASVSSTHATLQRRGNDWYVVDADSKNGTFVEGNRVSGERKLAATCEIRFGGVKALFRALGAGQPDGPSTHAVAGVTDAPIITKRRRK